MYCPNLSREPKVGDTLVYSYIDIHSGEKTIIELPPNSGCFCNQETGKWYVHLNVPPNPKD